MKLDIRPKNQHGSFSKRVVTWSAISVAVITLSVVSEKTAHAALLSFMNSLLGGQQVSASIDKPTSTFSSQNLGLQGHVAINPTALLSDDTIPVDDSGQTLLPDIAGNNVDSTDEGIIQKSSYTVQQDDTLSSIADMFDISVDTIKQANNLASNTVRPGQVLVILPVSGILYTVQSKDTFESIATKLKANINDILIYNNLTMSSTLKQGQQLIIPHGKPTAREIKTYLSTQKVKVPSFEPILDAVWNWPSYPGYFSCPLPGARLTQGLHGHNAVDLAIARGTPILAAAAGTVIISKSNGLWNGGYGNFVMLSHSNGAETLYAHMSKPTVGVGEHVSKGETIGYVGMTGMTSGPHTHFEIRNAQNPFVDPALCQ